MRVAATRACNREELTVYIIRVDVVIFTFTTKTLTAYLLWCPMPQESPLFYELIW
jgi:phage shock protein PspC (stress-responsive transcriptional regulator)